MKYEVYDDTLEAFKICILVPQIKKAEIKSTYVTPFGIAPEDVLILDLHLSGKKTPKKEMVAYIEEELQSVLDEAKVEYILCTDPEYFKTLTKDPKAEANLGIALKSQYGTQQVLYAPSLKAMFYDPIKNGEKVTQACNALTDLMNGTYQELGKDIIKFEEYPETDIDIEHWFNKLNEYPALTCDIEAFSLFVKDAGIATISFAWNQHEGIALAIDAVELEGKTVYIPNSKRRTLLKNFFINYEGNLKFHNITFDATILIYYLFMEDVTDTEGCLDGLKFMLKNFDCTKLISYLALNSCAGNDLSLKTLAQPFTGNYAEADIKDITKIPLKKLLRYNLTDTLATWYTSNTYYPRMVEEDQEHVYTGIFKDTAVDIVQMQLTGFPLNMSRVLEVETQLLDDQNEAIKQIMDCSVVQQYQLKRYEDWVTHKNSVLKKKRVTLADAQVSKDTPFNVNSGDQLQELLYEFIGLPVIELTDSKKPATDKDTLKALKNHTDSVEIKSLLDGLLAYTAVNKIVTSFIPAMKNAIRGKDGNYYLLGFFNLGGTVSGRLSSNNPNLN